jgi:hypothetical protein
MAVPHGNQQLVAALNELGWTLAGLAREINQVMRSRQVSRQTVSDWVHHGRTPHDPMPTVVAHLLSNALERTISVEQLWSGSASPSTLWVPADAGVSVPWDLGGTVAVLDDWLRGGGPYMDTDRREFLSIAGAAFTASAWGYVDSPSSGMRGISLATAGRGSLTITARMVDVVDAAIHGLRTLDDTDGGNADNLRFVHRHVLMIADWLRNARFTSSAVTDRLLGTWAQLAQLAGWTAADAEQHGLAQRYYRTGLHAAHSAGARDVGAHILGCMTYHAIRQDRLRDAVELANAATEAAKNTPAAVRALTATRYAHAQAAIGNLREVRAATEEARNLMARPQALQTRPTWLYWLETLDVVTGESLLTAADATSRDPKMLLAEAEQLIGPWLTSGAETEPRDVLFDKVRLARTHAQHGDLDQALATGWTTLTQASSVSSRTCRIQLRGLDTDLASHRGAAGKPEVITLRNELAAVLAA